MFDRYCLVLGGGGAPSLTTGRVCRLSQSVSSNKSIVSMYNYLHFTYMFHVLLNTYTIYTKPLSVQAQYRKLCPISGNFGYNGSLVTWTVVCLTAAKFKPLIFCSSPYAKSYLKRVTGRLQTSREWAFVYEPELRYCGHTEHRGRKDYYEKSRRQNTGQRSSSL
jgi:hypothetical protein